MTFNDLGTGSDPTSLCSRHGAAALLQHAALLLGSAVGSSGLSDLLGQGSVSGTHRHLHGAPHRAQHVDAAGQAGRSAARQEVLEAPQRVAVSCCPQGKVPTREAIHLYYQEQMMKSSRESGLDVCCHDDEVQMAGERGEDNEGAGTDQQEEESPETNLDLEPDGLEEQTANVLHPEEKGGGDYPESPAATTSQQSRPKLSRMDRVESSSVSSSSDEEEGLMCSHRWVSFPPRR